MKELDLLIESFFDHIDFRSLPPDYAERDFEREIVQKNCALVFIKDNQPTIHSPTKHHDRLKDFEYCLNIFCENHKVKDFKFLTVLNDGMRMNVPSLSPNRLRKNWFNNIPLPMGNQRGVNKTGGRVSGCGTPIIGWDQYVKDILFSTHSEYPWEKKTSKVVFRGQLANQTWKLGFWGKEKSEKWQDINRGYFFNKFKDNNLFDAGIYRNTSPFTEGVPLSNTISFKDQQKYKFMINIGANVDWAERLRLHFFTNSVTVIHGAECIEWFYPLLKPYCHYIPTDIFFSDLEDNIKWALANDDICQQIVKNANNFAKKYLSEDAMHYAFSKTLTCFSELAQHTSQ